MSVFVSCQYGKHCQSVFPNSLNKVKFPLEIIHTNIWGLTLVISYKGYHYYVYFIDECINYIWIFPLKSKSELFAIFTQFQNLVERQFDQKK